MAEIVDQENTTGGVGIGFGDSGAGRDYMAQGFVPLLDNITAVEFDMNGTNGDLHIWIDDGDSNSEPQGTVAVGIGGSTKIANADLSTSSKKHTLDSSVSLTPGANYVVVFAPWEISPSDAWAENYNDYESSTANPYANGRRNHGNTAYTTWSAPDSGNADIVFKTYGNWDGPIVEDTFDSGDTTGVSSVTLSVTVPSGSDLGLIITTKCRDGTDADRNITSVVFNTSENASQMVENNVDAKDLTVEQWFLANPTVTTANVVVTFAGTVDVADVSVLVVSNVGQTGQPDDTGVADGTGNTPSASVTTTVDDCLVVGVLYTKDNVTPGVNAGTAKVDAHTVNSGGDGAASSYAYKGTAGSQSMGYTNNSASEQYVVAAVAYAPPAGAATGIRSQRQLIGHGQGTRD